MALLSSKVALISGGAGGMGAAHARAIVGHGGKVVIGDLQDAPGRALAAELGAAAHYVHLDVTCLDDWRVAVAEAVKVHSALNVLVNNAGIITTGPLGLYTEAQFRDLISVNLVGTFLGMTAAVDVLKRCAPASIINISSTAGIVGFPELHGYTASKFAIRGLTKSAALELGEHGVRVNSVHPGLVRTPMTEGVPQSAAQNVYGRFAEPDEVSELVVFLASDQSRFSTGAEFMVDGGECAGRAHLKLSELR